MSQLELYNKMVNRVNKFLKVSGSQFDSKDRYETAFNRFNNRKFYCFNMFWILSHLFGEFHWLSVKYATESIVKLTYLIPCVTLCVLGCLKSYFLIKHGNHVNDLIVSMKQMQADVTIEIKTKIHNEMMRRTVFLTTFINANVVIYTFGLTIFATGPIFLSWVLYKSTGNLVMQLPFLSTYPFDETDIRYWPLAYIHQIWAGFIAISTVHGPDSFYSLSCTFLQIQFISLQCDIERVINEISVHNREEREEFRGNFVRIIKQHQELIRCVDIIETIYSKSTLCNIAVSSIVICVSAFNITTIEDYFLMTPFIEFLLMWLLQVFSLCYYSDLLIQSSVEVSDAVYNSLWYKADAATMKDLLFIFIRSQKPCKLTAMGFTDLNLRVFNKIVSSSWSYFALLQSVYKNKY